MHKPSNFPSSFAAPPTLTATTTTKGTMNYSAPTHTHTPAPTTTRKADVLARRALFTSAANEKLKALIEEVLSKATTLPINVDIDPKTADQANIDEVLKPYRFVQPNGDAWQIEVNLNKQIGPNEVVCRLTFV